MEEKKIAEIIDLCVDILAHDSLDYEVNIDGNGCNAFECANVAYEVLKLLEIKKEQYLPLVDQRILEIEE